MNYWNEKWNRMDVIKLSQSHRGSDGAVHSTVAVPVSLSGLEDVASNYNDVNFDGANEAVLDTDNGRICMVSGYTADRGMYCDIY